MVDTRAAEAEKLWTDSQSDAKLLADLRAAYRGRFDVLDALWWRAHPGVPTPQGVPDPAAELVTLSASVYSVPTTAEPLVEFIDPVSNQPVRSTEDGRRLRLLTLHLAEDAAALDAAIHNSSQPPTLPPASALSMTPGGRQRDRAGRKAAAVCLAALALLGVGAATTILEPMFGPDADVAAAPEVLQIFTDHDRYPVVIAPDLGNRFNPASIRSVTPPGAEQAGYEMYVAQNTDGDYCVVLQNLEGRLDTRCTSAVELASSGLRLDAVVIPPPSVLESSQPPIPFDVTVIWSTDGTFTAAFSPRPRLPGY
ncbi:MAG TPA: hypothetical protein VEX88_14875 [Glaciibacter sp.]|nr:hypothetical protein [Glaciibacter sp.]